MNLLYRHTNRQNALAGLTVMPNLDDNEISGVVKQNIANIHRKRHRNHDSIHATFVPEACAVGRFPTGS